MKQFLLGLSLLLLIGFSSCEKKMGPSAACFNLSRTPGKVNDTLYLLNCSVNYSYFRWTVPSIPYVDSSNRHLKLVPTAAGDLVVALLVTNPNKDTNIITKTIQIQ